MTAWEDTLSSPDPFSGAGGATELVELVGPDLRVSGTMHLGRFARLSDLVNHSRGFVQVRDARLLRRNGEPTSLVMANLMVNQDEITFIGQAAAARDAAPDETLPAGKVLPTGEVPSVGETLLGDRPTIEKVRRRYVVFASGIEITGFVHVHQEMAITNFVEASDLRFVPFTAVTVRSLADRAVLGQFEFVLVNRTQMMAVAELEPHQDVGDALAEVEKG